MFKRHFSEFLRTKSRLLGTILEFAAWTKPSHLFSSVAHILFTLLQSHQPPTASLQSSFSPHDICTLSISSWGAFFQTSLLPSSSLLSGLYRGLPQVKLVWFFSTSHGFPVIPLSFLLSFFLSFSFFLFSFLFLLLFFLLVQHREVTYLLNTYFLFFFTLQAPGA